MKKWLLYTITIGFALYWLSNLLLWVPWSYAAWLGMTIMLTVSPVIWGYGVYKSLIKFPGHKLLYGAFVISIVFTSCSVVADYFFFVLIRDAKEQLYHPTTFYGYAFVFTIPFLEILFLRKSISGNRTGLINKDFRLPVLLFIISLSSLMILAKFY